MRRTSERRQWKSFFAPESGSDSGIGETDMFNDKAFTAYAFLLITGTACVLTYAVVAQGGSFPPLVYMIEHLLMALALRAAYKSFDGPAWFPYPSQIRGMSEEVEITVPGSAAGALG
jgi:hypothetical protein